MEWKVKIKRDAFLYLDGSDARFAQCGTCVTGYSTCKIMDNIRVSAEFGSCGFYMRGKAVLTLAIAKLTKQQTGYVERRVRCENCKFFYHSISSCHLFYMLNKWKPEVFDLDTKVEKHGCCNAQTPS